MPFNDLFFERGRTSEELEVMYKDFVERDSLQKVVLIKFEMMIIKDIQKFPETEVPSRISSCKDFVQSTYSLAAIGIKKVEDSDSCHLYSRGSLCLTDEENNMYRSHSSSIHSNSHVALNSRKPSLAKSTNAIFRR